MQGDKIDKGDEGGTRLKKGKGEARSKKGKTREKIESWGR